MPTTTTLFSHVRPLIPLIRIDRQVYRIPPQVSRIGNGIAAFRHCFLNKCKLVHLTPPPWQSTIWDFLERPPPPPLPPMQRQLPYRSAVDFPGCSPGWARGLGTYFLPCGMCKARGGSTPGERGWALHALGPQGCKFIVVRAADAVKDFYLRIGYENLDCAADDPQFAEYYRKHCIRLECTVPLRCTVPNVQDFVTPCLLKMKKRASFCNEVQGM